MSSAVGMAAHRQGRDNRADPIENDRARDFTFAFSPTPGERSIPTTPYPPCLAPPPPPPPPPPLPPPPPPRPPREPVPNRTLKDQYWAEMTRQNNSNSESVSVTKLVDPRQAYWQGGAPGNPGPI